VGVKTPEEETMDAINVQEAFAESITTVAEHLRLQLEQGSDVESTNTSLEHLFGQGAELGLTEKEIVRQLITPVSAILRPGHNR
jgi:hypothetical protein